MSIQGSERHVIAEIPMPAAIARLDRDKHGRSVPYFVHRDPDGVPDFRVSSVVHVNDAVRFGWCWVCGRPRGRHAAFVIGPMCGINRVSAEPPCHLDCAVYSARACPFLARPAMVRRDKDLGPLQARTPGLALERNPGVALVWSSRSWRPFDSGRGRLFDIGEPTAVRWYARGREATRAEVLASVESGLPELESACQHDDDPAGSLRDLARQVQVFMPLVPPEVTP